MKTKVFTLAIALNAFAVAPMWAQQQMPDPNLIAQLEKRLAESDTKARNLTGGPKGLWLLRQRKIENLIERLKSGQSVDPKELDVVFKGQVN
jgi:hypothetical protein